MGIPFYKYIHRFSFGTHITFFSTVFTLASFFSILIILTTITITMIHRLTEDMYEDGYLSITNIDISRTVIEGMMARHKDKAGITWQVMNVCALAYGDSSYDTVIDKATLDSLLCGDNSTANASRYCSEVARILKPGGVFFVISYGIPENRLSYLENDEYGWRVTVSTLPKPTVSPNGVPDGTDPSQVHYIYICTKR